MEVESKPEVGRIYKGKVVKVMEFGVFVSYLGTNDPRKDGLVHMSQFASNPVEQGQDVFVKLIGFDHRGKVQLSIKAVDQTTGEEV